MANQFSCWMSQKGFAVCSAPSAGGFVALLAVRRRFRSALPGGVDHHFNIGGGRFQLELQPRGFTREKVEGNERNDRNGQAADFNPRLTTHSTAFPTRLGK